MCVLYAERLRRFDWFKYVFPFEGIAIIHYAKQKCRETTIINVCFA